MRLENLSSCHPNILKGVIVGKKSWGLHVKMWSEGISDGYFRICEIIDDFTNKEIYIPEPLMIDFENTIKKNVKKKLVHLSNNNSTLNI
jgi:hypothetical protein